MPVVTLAVLGMTCSACTASVTEALERIPQVQQASVSLLTNEAKVTYSAPLDPQRLVEAIEDCGFNATLFMDHTDDSTLFTTTLNVTGMTCSACSSSVSEALQSHGGVQKCTVSLLTNEAKVVHTSAVLSQKLVSVVEDCGFDTSVAQTTAQKIEKCGFNAALVPLRPAPGQNNLSDTVLLRIYGLSDTTNFPVYQHNVQAVLTSLSGVLSFEFRLHSQKDKEDLYSPDSNIESLIDILEVRIASELTGVRVLIDALSAIDSQYQYAIFNSIDQSLSLQLKIISRANDILYWRRIFYSTLSLGVPTIALNATQNFAFWHRYILTDGLFVVTILQLALASVVLFVFGMSFFKRFKFFLVNKGRSANMDVLVCISSSITYCFSLISIALSVWSGETTGPPRVFFDTIVMLFAFVSFGKWIENKAKGATSFALSRLLSLTPSTCLIVLCDEYDSKHPENLSKFPTRDIPIDLIQKDDIVVVILGSKMPIDGVILFGETDVDESVITGESLPVHKAPGSHVIGGSINGPCVVYVQVTGAGKNSQLHQIINTVRDLQVNKAPVQRFADFIAARFMYVILGLSLLTLIFWLVCAKFFSDLLPAVFHKDANGPYFVCFNLAISVIVVACPCALGLAAPTAVMVGTGVGATHGALIKGGDVLEKANDVNVILFDKTGTLTRGEMDVVNSRQVATGQDLDEDTWWNLVGALEAKSEHPIARAIVNEARKKLGHSFAQDTFQSTLSDLKALPGMGLSANILLEGRTYNVAVGNITLLLKRYPEVRVLLEKVLENELANSMSTICHVLVDKQYRGYMELSDSIKSSARDVIQYLQHQGHYQVGMVSGDSIKVAQKVGSQLGISEGNIFGDVFPIEKDKIVESIRGRFGGPKNVSIAFVGDGINDAPALVRSDLGMAISSGTGIAVDSAEVVLLGSEGSSQDLQLVITALEVSQATFSKIKWNFFFACIYNAFMLPLAMGCFLPFNLMISPAVAAGAMACSSISVVLNSLALKSWKPPKIDDARFDVHESDVQSFSLKHSSLEEFNAIKRNGIYRRIGWFGLKKGPRSLSDFFSRSSPQEYELLPTSS